MTNPTKSAALKARIAQLEGEVAGKLRQIGETEASVAKSYEDGTSPGAAVKNLAALRDELTGAVAALRTLDRRHYEVAQAEFNEALARLKSAIEEKFRGAVQAIESALGGVDLARFDLDTDALDPVKRNLRESLWDGYLRRSTAAQLALGRPPREPWPRDDLGRPVDPDAALGEPGAGYRITPQEVQAAAIMEAAYSRPSEMARAVHEARE